VIGRRDYGRRRRLSESRRAVPGPVSAMPKSRRSWKDDHLPGGSALDGLLESTCHLREIDRGKPREVVAEGLQTLGGYRRADNVDPPGAISIAAARTNASTAPFTVAAAALEITGSREGMPLVRVNDPRDAT
jgi:hypothetical protein